MTEAAGGSPALAQLSVDFDDPAYRRRAYRARGKERRSHEQHR